MKIFLTEIEEKGKKYAGPNIVAENLAEAEEAAKAAEHQAGIDNDTVNSVMGALDAA